MRFEVRVRVRVRVEWNGSTVTLGRPGAPVAAALSPGVVRVTPKHSSALVAAASCSVRVRVTVRARIRVRVRVRDRVRTRVSPSPNPNPNLLGRHEDVEDERRRGAVGRRENHARQRLEVVAVGRERHVHRVGINSKLVVHRL